MLNEKKNTIHHLCFPIPQPTGTCAVSEVWLETGTGSWSFSYWNPRIFQWSVLYRIAQNHAACSFVATTSPLATQLTSWRPLRPHTDVQRRSLDSVPCWESVKIKAFCDENTSGTIKSLSNKFKILQLDRFIQAQSQRPKRCFYLYSIEWAHCGLRMRRRSSSGVYPLTKVVCNVWQLISPSHTATQFSTNCWDCPLASTLVGVRTIHYRRVFFIMTISYFAQAHYLQDLANERNSQSPENKLLEAVRRSLPSQKCENMWVTHFSPIIFIEGSKNEIRRRAFVAVDRCAVYIFIPPVRNTMCGPIEYFHSYRELRIPLVRIVGINCTGSLSPLAVKKLKNLFNFQHRIISQAWTTW